MPTERIIIENFKGIENLDLEVKPFTVLIGPQSVGKSVTAKLLYYFKTIAWEIFRGATEDSEGSIDARLVERFNKFLPSPTHTKGKSSIRYQIGEVEISIRHDGKENSHWKIELPDLFLTEFTKIKDLFSKSTEKQPDFDLRKASYLRHEAQRQYLKNIELKLGQTGILTPRFIPAGRSFYSQIEKDVVSFFESANLDPHVAGFGRFLSHLKEMPVVRNEKGSAADALAAELASRLLSGRYEREDKKDYIHVKDGRKLHSALWSSGQQEGLPLVFLLLRYVMGDMVVGRKMCLFIEEPEAHLFPTSQKTIVELIALAFNSERGMLNLFITTHSPYVLSTLNVLLRAGQFLEKNSSDVKRRKIAHVINPLIALSPGSVGAYYMDHNQCRSIIDPESGLIHGAAIDDISGEIAEQFDAIGDLQ